MESPQTTPSRKPLRRIAAYSVAILSLTLALSALVAADHEPRCDDIIGSDQSPGEDYQCFGSEPPVAGVPCNPPGLMCWEQEECVHNTSGGCEEYRWYFCVVRTYFVIPGVAGPLCVTNMGHVLYVND